MFDCTSFVVHFFAKSRCNRHVERSETSVTLLRMTKGLIFGAQPAGHAWRQPDVCGPAPAKAAARTAQGAARRNDIRTETIVRILRRIHPSDCFTAPATGYRYRETGELVGDGTGGHSWSASSLTTDHFQVGSLWFGSDYMGALNSTHRSHALSVRCVQASAQKLSFLRMHAPGPGVFPSSPETFSFSAQPSVRRIDRLSINRSKIC